jgi:hypothetical protein
MIAAPMNAAAEGYPVTGAFRGMRLDRFLQQMLPPRLLGALGELRRQHFPEDGARRIARGSAHGAARRRIGEHDFAAGIDDDDAFAQSFEHRPRTVVGELERHQSRFAAARRLAARGKEPGR